MLTVAQFEEWLSVFRYTGTAFYAGTAWQVDENDLNKFIRLCQERPADMQEMLDQGHCDEGRQAMAYLKYLEQAEQSYSMVL